MKGLHVAEPLPGDGPKNEAVTYRCIVFWVPGQVEIGQALQLRSGEEKNEVLRSR